MTDKDAVSAQARTGKAELPQDFETALARLEALVAQMESGALPLDQALAAYEEGVELAKICQRRLDQAEQQVKVLQGNLLKPLADSPDAFRPDAARLDGDED
ncbi:exodeoxyribonuclease VII small subunit [Parapusillimonas sp. SGNA-6]|jgi:exodeoxyribonuclease VII small subunit|nr:exodeoxyribonuclease VII small subunit [Parapusillimonas sp. SGNA-6]